MTRIENHCCGCSVPAYPCLGILCPERNVKVLYCDFCGNEAETLYRVDDGIDEEEICYDCLDNMMERSGLTYKELVTATIR
jgi:hypothetical protein